MIGANVGAPAPMAAFALSGWNRSFFGDLHVQGIERVTFNTRQKIVWHLNLNSGEFSDKVRCRFSFNTIRRKP